MTDGEQEFAKDEPGGQITDSRGRLRGLGPTITTAACVIDRNAGGATNIARGRSSCGHSSRSVISMSVAG